MFHKYGELNIDTSSIISCCGSQKLNLGKNHKTPEEKFKVSRMALEKTIKVMDSQRSKAKKSRFKDALRFSSENSVLKGYDNILIIP